MATLIFGAHQTTELSMLLRSLTMRPYIQTAYVRPIKYEFGQFKCKWKKEQSKRQTTQLASDSADYLLCGHCWNGVIRLYDPPHMRAMVPECFKCGAKVCGVELDMKMWLDITRGPMGRHPQRDHAIQEQEVVAAQMLVRDES